MKSKKCKIKIISLFLMILMSFTFLPISVLASETYRNVDTSKKVYDYADLLTDTQEKTLKKEIDKLIKKYEYDIFIVTINDNNENTSNPTRKFIEDFGDYNNFGLSEKEPAYVSLIIDMENREVYIDCTGLKCQKVYSDSRIDSILDDIMKYMGSENYYKATDSFLKNIKEYGNKSSGEPVYDEYGNVIDKNTNISDRLPKALIKGILSGLLLSGIITIIIICNSKPVKKATEASQYKSSSLNLTHKNDRLIRTYETKVKIQTNK